MDFQSEFPQDTDLIYLNHAAVAPWPKRTQEAVQNFANENLVLGATHYPDWLKTEQSLRENLKSLINARSTDEIALVKNTSEALSVVAYGIDWQPGDEIIISNEEFPSNSIVWESLSQFGVKTVKVDLYANELSPEENLTKAINDKTRLLSISSVQYASGTTMDLKTIGKACKQADIYFCVDAIQSLGALPMDAQAIQADFIMADGHKWMLGPEGLGLFYCRKEVMADLTIRQFGWHMIKEAGNYDADSWQVADTAKRFECGSPNMLGAYALNASLSLILEVGMNTISSNIIENTKYLRALIEQEDKLELISFNDPDRIAGITTFKVNGADQKALYQTLMKNNLICANRGGGIRFSPHFYQTEALLDRAIERLLSYC